MLYTDFKIKNNSAVCKHFLWDEEGQAAICKLLDCKKNLKFGGGLTKGLHIHIHILSIKVDNMCICIWRKIIKIYMLP